MLPLNASIWNLKFMTPLSQTNKQAHIPITILSRIPFERLLTVFQQQNNRSLSTLPEKQFALTHQCYEQMAIFASTCFPSHCRTSFGRMHHEFFSLIPRYQQRSQRIVIAAPRGHAKTTIMLLFYALHAICYGYEPYILIIAQTTP